MARSMYRRIYVFLSRTPHLDLIDKVDLEGHVVYAAYHPKESPEKEMLETLQSAYPKAYFHPVFHHMTTSIMGRTFDHAIISIFRSIEPDSLGRTIETVRGGGNVIILGPPPEILGNSPGEFHKEFILTYPYSAKDIVPLFVKRLIKKFVQHDIVELRINGKLIKKGRAPKSIKRRRKIEIPKDIEFPEEIYRKAVTQDQVEALKALEFLLPRKPKERRAVVIIANRGRGKSAILGLALAAIAHKYSGKGYLGRFFIPVIAPARENVNTLFEFFKIGLETLGYRPKVFRDEIKAKGIIASYIPPSEAPRIIKDEKARIAAVDEAAGIPTRLLERITELVDRIAFSSTIHGYEGAGRGFALRFLKRLKNMAETKIVRLEEPIRYPPGDPVEKFLYDALLLDAEPVDKNLVDLSELKFVELDKRKLFLDRDERLLREFIGIYIFAHYRNRPKDLMILGDSPHHRAFAVLDKNGHVVAALQIAVEGGFDRIMAEEMYKGNEPRGHMIPQRIVDHYRTLEFPQLKGFRVVRIAVHPELQGRGIGSFALKELEKVAKNEGLDRMGAGFGGTPELMRFRSKNGFVPLHVSPVKQESSGEYSVIVLKPISDKAKSLIGLFYKEFRLRFLSRLRHVHYDMDTELARLLLKAPLYLGEERLPNLTLTQRRRLGAYVRSRLSFETTCDAVEEIARTYFLDESPEKPQLRKEREKLFIVKIFQSRSRKLSANILDVHPKRLKERMARATRKLFKYYRDRAGIELEP